MLTLNSSVKEASTVPTCHLCWNLRFPTYLEFHAHYEEHHVGNLKDAHTDVQAEIRRRAIATPKNVSGRTKAQIVAALEEYWKGWFLVE